ncbi:NADP-dependent 3-hydroxy acid dehydrogenase YdfG [Pseudomonas guineae]|uniref:NADP-dependent 3-hydroxy acid dehydrogenase YdfG n=2 Tax=Pseudomonas guineae TaxID=425504 RepID=A0A1I3CTH3_9PSED|nr:NADP-dependent 3-hydroxy acid dehydrogenase YdfG [Pseudomonas guineae]|tara:strand:- start:4895 stop:5773 length:879 start_codon:yes stop_codon:yes gene_type:complete
MVCRLDNSPGYTGPINHSSKGSFPMQNRMMITGAGSGLGREIALRWAREGWQLALSDVNEPGLTETLQMVRDAGGDGFTQRCDVRDYSQLTAFAQACEEKLGGIDVIVNNAGVASGGFFSELSLEDWDWQIAINLMGVVKGCKAFLPLLEKSKGKIVNIASMAALMQGPAMSNYNVAKAGVVALSESLLIELKMHEVGVHVVCPSFFQTNLLDSFRGPTPAMKAQVGKLLESSPISAADIADYIYQEIDKGEFMILPHEQGRMAWALKKQNAQLLYDEMTKMADKMRAPRTK